MRYVLGVDTGSCATTAVVADETGCLLGIGQAAAARVRAGGRAGQRGPSGAGDAVRTAITMADLENARIAAACLTEDPLRPNDVDRLEAIPASQILAGPEGQIALYSVTLGQAGVVVLSGARALAYGRNACGDEAQAGGWGRAAGSDGSAAWMAERALRACCRSHDGLAPPTALTEALRSRLEAADLAQMLEAADAKSPCEMACVSDAIAAAAAEGDAAACRILRDAGRELAALAAAVIGRLRLGSQAPVVGAAGAGFRMGRPLLRTFRRGVLAAAPRAIIVSPQASQAVGAALLALESLEVELNEQVLARIRSSISRFAAAGA